MLAICIVMATWLRVATETLPNVAFAQQRVDCEHLLNTPILTKVEYSH